MLQLCELSQCGVKEREAVMNLTDKFLRVDEVCSQFGTYVKLLCTANQPSTSTAVTLNLQPRRNDFDVLMSAASSQQSKLPERISTHNKKDVIFNDLIGLFEENGWSCADSGNTLGKSFLLMLIDVLWYIDSHHSVFERHSFPIPEIFRKFSGYNTPEVS